MAFVENMTNGKGLAGNSDVPTFRGSHFGGRIPKTELTVEVGYRF